MPQGAWSKRERQYEHIKDSELDSGRSEDRAEEIAARTVNKPTIGAVIVIFRSRARHAH